MTLQSHERGALSSDTIARYRTAFNSHSPNILALNAVTKTAVTSIAMNRRSVVRDTHTYSHLVKVGPSTTQEKSGRCWIFAALNTFRPIAAKQLGLEDVELSQAYLFFYDKLEKANFFLEAILSTMDEPTDGRLISTLVQSPVQDGGQWDMFVNLVEKYGVVPKSIMPETESSSNSGRMNERVTLKLREFAAQLRQSYSDGITMESLIARKDEMLSEIYKMLSIHLGEPPREFLWQWRDKDNKFHRDDCITPQEFFDKYVAFDFNSVVCLIHCPMASTPFNQLYTVDYLGNIVGGHGVRYINVEMDILKAAAVAQIKDDKSVWFGCDVGKCFDRDLGVMDTELFDFESVYSTHFGLSKAQRLDYGSSQMTHAMVFTGVDLDEHDRPRKWRVENSWGDKGGDKGFMLMTDAWFDEYNYEVVVDKKYVPAKVLSILNNEPISLPPWHPMGSLA